MEEEIHPNRIYSVTEAARRLGMSPDTLYRRMRDRRITHCRKLPPTKGFFFREEWIREYEEAERDRAKDDEATKYYTKMRRGIKAKKELSTTDSVTQGVTYIRNKSRKHKEYSDL